MCAHRADDFRQWSSITTRCATHVNLLRRNDQHHRCLCVTCVRISIVNTWWRPKEDLMLIMGQDFHRIRYGL